MLNSEALAPVIVGLEMVNAIEPVFNIANVLVTVQGLYPLVQNQFRH